MSKLAPTLGHLYDSPCLICNAVDSILLCISVFVNTNLVHEWFSHACCIRVHNLGFCTLMFSYSVWHFNDKLLYRFAFCSLNNNRSDHFLSHLVTSQVRFSVILVCKNSHFFQWPAAKLNYLLNLDEIILFEARFHWIYYASSSISNLWNWSAWEGWSEP